MTTALVSDVVEQLSAMINYDAGLLSGFEKEVRYLVCTFRAIQAVLEDADRKQVTDEVVRDWIRKRNEVAHSVEDIVDELRKDASKSQGDEDAFLNCMKVRSCLLFPSPCLKQVKLRHNAERRISELKEILNKLLIESRCFNFSLVDADEWLKTEQLQTSSPIHELEIFGRDGDKERIIKDLVRGTSQEEKPLSVISIVGTGGLGKTTVARLVYSDERVRAHFPKRIWVCVSDPFDIRRIGTSVLESMAGSSSHGMDMETLQYNLSVVVCNKRFLLVLDDVWNEDVLSWEKLKLLLLSGAAQESKILVTTRTSTVANVMETTHIHYLGILSDSDSWSLFASRAFRGREEKERLELIEMAQKIVDRCKGVPLSLEVVGNLLYTKRKRVTGHTSQTKCGNGIMKPCYHLSY